MKERQATNLQKPIPGPGKVRLALKTQPRAQIDPITIDMEDKLEHERESSSLRLAPEANAIRNTVLYVRCWLEMQAIGSKGGFFRASRTTPRSQEGTTDLDRDRT